MWTHDNVIRLKIDKSKLTPISIPERKNKILKIKVDLKYPQTYSQSAKTNLGEIK